ncbi:NDP-hexose 2,3-dehydratase family protein [Nocardia acidivorans]|uniref:NDP-hexose 2,3-dehydratase family protein n=1 Tax=Nocardia acidivorans TaxID=404580 RepID=UPI00082EE543|nr:NDP-hexose 2,3-dehydratase family protein [Nocardia acidivorans]
MIDQLPEFFAWFDKCRERNDYEVRRIGLDDAPGWHIEPRTGDLSHETGKFLSVRGVEIDTDHRDTAHWRQPIILQPETGILGILVTRVRGAVYCLMQAKMEPGNINLLQLSPTVQATRSNYTKVHGGKSVPYLEYFTDPAPGRVLVDAMQSEQGAWFLHKRNRNMVVEVTGDIPVHEDFHWIRLDCVARLLVRPHVVNMSARSVLAGMVLLYPELSVATPYSGPARHSLGAVLSWLRDARARYRLTQSPIPLRAVPEWNWVDGTLEHEAGLHFSIIGVDVRASNREITRWSQPLLRPIAAGVIGFAVRHFDGVPHFLVHARTEAGTREVVEIGPTVAAIPANYTGLPAIRRPRYLDALLTAAPGAVLVDVLHSEEGGRFYRAENRYVIADLGPALGESVPPDYHWVSLPQLVELARYGNLVNIAARSLLSCLLATTLGLEAAAADLAVL